MFETIDHIGLAVTDIAEAVALYQTQFGVHEWEIIELPERHMRVAITTIGTSMVELIAPTAPEAAFAKYLAEKGPGMHHIAYEVEDVGAELRRLSADGVQLIDERPRKGLFGLEVAFIHPDAVHGVLAELVAHVEEH